MIMFLTALGNAMEDGANVLEGIHFPIVHLCDGERFTLADVSWIVILDRIVEVDWEAYFWSSGKRPHVAAYWDRLRSRPSYAKAILEARCETLERGIADVKRAKDENPELRAALEGTH